MSTTATAEQPFPHHHPISSSGVRDLTISFVPLVQRLGKVFRAMTDIRLAEIGVTSGQDQLLDAMPETGTLSVSAMADVLRIRASTVSKMVDRLAEKGLVRRIPAETDARLTLVGLTDAGRDKQREVRQVWAALEQELACASTTARMTRMNVLAELEAQIAGRLARLR